MAKEKYLEAARISATHGVKGMVRLECMTDTPDVLCDLPVLYFKKGGGYSPLHIERASIYKRAVLAAFREITDLDNAIPMKGQILWAAREDIPLEEGKHFIADMLGLTVTDDVRGTVGTLEDVITPAGRQVYVIKKADGSTFMMPAVPEFVLDIVTEGDDVGITVHLIDGMMD